MVWTDETPMQEKNLLWRGLPHKRQCPLGSEILPSVLRSLSVLKRRNNGETIKFRSPRTAVLLSHLQQNPKATIAELSSALEINTSAVQKQLSTLEVKGYITKDPDSKAWRFIAVSTTK